MKADLYRRNVVIVFCLVIAGLLDAVLLTREGLWVDEVFSLAMATGHSLEHPATQVNPSFGDFQEPPQPVDPSYFRRYSEHEDPPASLSRVVRGIMISDTNPPLYYLLLHYWTRWVGTTDIALRLFSLFFALACFPVLWSLGRQLGGRRTAAFSCLFFSLSPVALQYSVEGRMYSLLWFLVLAMVWFILNLRKNGLHKIYGPLLVLTGTAGLLTHYYFIFVYLAFALWVLFDPGHLNRTKWLLLFLCMVIFIAPWYRYVPESLSSWRVTKDWLRHPVPLGATLIAPFFLWWRLLSPSVLWQGQIAIDVLVALAIVSAILLVNYRRLSLRRELRTGGIQLPRATLLGGRLWPWIWLLTACLGPSVQDMIFHTRAAWVSRYALSGLPVAQLLIGYWIARLKPVSRKLCLVLLIAGYIMGTWAMWYAPQRAQHHFRELAAQISSRAQPEDLIIVHSIPSGVICLSRYLTKSIPVISWVGQLNQRKVPQDIQQFVHGRRRIVLLKIHYLKEPAPEEEWLRENMKLVEEHRGPKYELFIFEFNKGEADF